MSCIGIILAAGCSSRLGRPKQLVDLGEGPLLHVVLRRALASSFSEVGVVLGAFREELTPELEGQGATLVYNHDWVEGMGSSIRVGARWAIGRGAHSVVLMVCDQIALTTEHLDTLLSLHRATRCTVASRYGGVLGVPAVFGRSWLGALAALRGGEGAKHILRRDPDAHFIDWPAGVLDLDTEADVQAFEYATRNGDCE